MNIDFTKDDLQKVIRNHNKALKKERISLAGKASTLLAKVKSKYSITKSGANKYTFTHKRENIKYEVEIGTDTRKAQDTKFKKQQDEKKKKAIARKTIKVAKKKADINKLVAKTRQEERRKTLQKIKIEKELKLKNMFKEHAKTNTKKHIKEMKKLMKQGDTFKQAHIKVKKTEPKKAPKPTQRNTLTTPKLQATQTRRQPKTTKKTPTLSRANTQMTPLGIPVDNNTMAALLGVNITKETGNVYFGCAPFIFTLMLLYILQKHKNDCIAINREGFKIVNGKMKEVAEKLDATFKKSISAYRQNFGITMIGQKISFMGMKKKDFFEGIKGCLDKNKMVVLPLSLRKGRSAHMNAIIINGNTKEIIRYEPHGTDTGSSTLNSTKINNNLRKAFSSLWSYIPGSKKGDWTYIDSRKSCPSGMGFRGLQAYSGSNVVNKIEIRKGDPGGFCCMWSLFIMDLSLKNPNMPIQEVRKKAQTFLQSYRRPNKTKDLNDGVRQFIRGYTKYLMGEAIPAFIKNAKAAKIPLPKTTDFDGTLEQSIDKYFKKELTGRDSVLLANQFALTIYMLIKKTNKNFLIGYS